MKASLPTAIFKATQSDLRKQIIREEDLTALVYLHVLIHEVESSQRFDHVVIDEAQDFSPFHIALLDLFVKGHSFTILGDLSQGIHEYRGVHAWEEMSSLFAPEHTGYFALTRSYRSTLEIIEFANTILEQEFAAVLRQFQYFVVAIRCALYLTTHRCVSRVCSPL